MTAASPPASPSSGNTIDRLISIASTQGIGAVIAVLLVTQVNARLDVLIARVGDVVTACAGK